MPARATAARRLPSPLAALWLMACIGCGPVLVWHGHSPDRARTARVLEEAGHQRLFVDAAAQTSFDVVGVSQLRWTTRGIAYPARSGARWRLVVDGAPGPAYDAIGEVVTAGNRVAYEAHDRAGWHVVVDGGVGPAFQSLRRGSLQFACEGQRVLYVARDDRGEHVVIDAQVGAPFAQVERLTVGAKGALVAYAGWDATGASVVVERAAVARFDEVLAVEIAAFEPHWAAIVSRGGVPAVVRDGSVVVDQPGAMDLRLSADGAHLAWTARVGEREGLWLDGRSHGTHVAVDEIQFVPRSDALVSVVRDTDGVRVVLDDAPGPRVDAVDALVTSDAGHWGYVASRGVGSVVVIDGVLRFRGEWAGSPVLAERSGRWAFVTRHGARRFVVTPDATTEIGRSFADTLVLDPEGAHWAIASADSARRRLEVIVDGRVVAPLDVDEIAAAITQEREAGPAVRAIVAGELTRALRPRTSAP